MPNNIFYYISNLYSCSQEIQEIRGAVLFLCAQYCSYSRFHMAPSFLPVFNGLLIIYVAVCYASKTNRVKAKFAIDFSFSPEHWEPREARESIRGDLGESPGGVWEHPGGLQNFAGCTGPVVSHSTQAHYLQAI